MENRFQLHGNITKGIQMEHKEHKKHEKHEKKHVKKMPKAKVHPKKKKPAKSKAKVEKVMHEFKEGKLHSGSKNGPEVSNPKQAIAIALSEARKSKRKKK